jgi:FKBP-type peptidyl-prolyl cis-trans isomerase FkpA
MRLLPCLLALALAGCSSHESSSAPETSAPSSSSSTSNDPKAALEKAAAEPGAVRTGSGLVYRELTKGSGPSPKATDTVTVNYRGTLPDGTEFDSSYKHGQAATFPLSQVIACWTEGVQKMQVGGKSKLTCPAEIAYGDRGAPPTIPPGATLIFEVELVGINH